MPELVKVGGVPCWVSRTGYSGELGYELFCSPDGAEQLWARGHGSRRATVRPRRRRDDRIESGLIFIGYDYFQHETSPYDMGLDKMIRFDGPDFCGKAALQSGGSHPPNRFVTLVVDGAVPEYGAAVTKDGERGRHADEPLREPDARQGDRTGGRTLGLARAGETVEVAVGDGNGAGHGRAAPALRHGQDATPRVSPTEPAVPREEVRS